MPYVFLGYERLNKQESVQKMDVNIGHVVEVTDHATSFSFHFVI